MLKNKDVFLTKKRKRLTFKQKYYIISLNQFKEIKMIHKLSFSNFYSFADENEISFVVPEHAKTNWYTKTETGTKLTKVMGIWGANASGKTNVLRVGAFISWFIENSFVRNAPEDLIPVNHFLFKKEPKQEVSFKADFELKGVIYSYFLIISKKQVLHESLKAKSLEDLRPSTLFKRVWDNQKKEFDFTFKDYKAPKDLAEVVKKRANASVISAGAQMGHELSKDLREYWANVMCNVSMTGKHHFSNGQAIDSAKFFHENLRLKNKADDLLCRFDLGLSKIKLQPQKLFNPIEKVEEEIIVPYGVHTIDGKEFPLVIFEESEGTKSLFVVLQKVLYVLDMGGIAILDEFDADLHPDMISELVNLFASKIHNPKNAQLLFSTHQTQLLNELEKYQIILTEKDEKNAKSEVWRLDEQENRPDVNLYKKYISGTYGAIPNIK